MSTSFDQSETKRLRFDSGNRVGDFTPDSVNFFNHRFACYDGRLVEGYEEFEFDLVLRVRVGTGREVYDLLFNTIPSGVFRNYHFGETDTAFDFCRWPLKVGSEWGQHGVIVGISERVQCAEKVISSVIRLERAQERVHLRRNVLAKTVKAVFKSGGVFGEGKVGFPGICALGSSNGVDCVVETGAEVADNIANQFRNRGIVKVFDEFDLVKELIRIAWVYFNDLSVRVYFDESLNFPFEIGEMFATPSNFAFRAIEWSRHYPDCSNLKSLFDGGSERFRMIPKAQLSPLRPIVC